MEINDKAKYALKTAVTFAKEDVMFYILDGKRNGADTTKAEKALFSLIYELNNLIYSNSKSVGESG